MGGSNVEGSEDNLMGRAAMPLVCKVLFLLNPPDQDVYSLLKIVLKPRFEKSASALRLYKLFVLN